MSDRSDDHPEDPLPAMRAELDQALAMAPELARVYRGYFNAFQGQGFTDAQALHLAACQTLQNPGRPPS